MYPFNYQRASALGDALQRLRADPEAKLLAGGMTLLPTMKMRLAAPSQLIDIARLAELRGIRQTPEGLVIGAAQRHVEVATDPTVRKTIAALADLAGGIGDPQVRARGTLGGSIANNDPAADYPAALLALDALVQTDRRAIAAADFFLGLFSTALAPDEIVCSVRFSLPRRAAYAKFAQPASGYAMAGVMVAEFADGYRVAVTGAGPGVFRWAAAEQALADGALPDAIERLPLDPAGLNADMHGSADYRAQLVKVMAARAVARINGSTH